MGAALLYIHISEYSQQETDDTVSRQQVQIETDALTGLYSRLAYSNELQRRDGAGRRSLPRSRLWRRWRWPASCGCARARPASR